MCRQKRFFSILFSMLVFLIVRPQTHIFAACAFLPSKINVTAAASSCAIDAGTLVGVDVTASENLVNTGVLTLNNAASAITINNTAQLYVGSVTVTAGTVTVQSGGILKANAPMWVTDADSDGYPVNLTLYSATGAGRRRFGLMTLTILDCNDADPATYANAVCYADADGDTYTTGGAQSVCGTSTTCGAGWRAAANGADCADNYADVWYSIAACYADIDTDGYGRTTSNTYTCINTASCATATVASIGTGTHSSYGYYSANNTDCNDIGTNAVNVYVSGTCYKDADNDNYGASGTTYTCMNNATCLSATWGSVGTATAYNYNFSNVSTDCCDTDINAYPSSAYCGSAVNACGAWEYDCDGAASEQCATSTYSCTNPCSGTTTSANITSSGWDAGVPGCGANGTWNMPDGAPHSGGTCYVGLDCAGIDYGSYAATQTCQ